MNNPLTDVLCPHCGEFVDLIYGNECANCGEVIGDDDGLDVDDFDDEFDSYDEEFYEEDDYEKDYLDDDDYEELFGSDESEDF